MVNTELVQASSCAPLGTTVSSRRMASQASSGATRGHRWLRVGWLRARMVGLPAFCRVCWVLAHRMESRWCARCVCAGPPDGVPVCWMCCALAHRMESRCAGSGRPDGVPVVCWMCVLAHRMESRCAGSGPPDGVPVVSWMCVLAHRMESRCAGSGPPDGVPVVCWMCCVLAHRMESRCAGGVECWLTGWSPGVLGVLVGSVFRSCAGCVAVCVMCVAFVFMRVLVCCVSRVPFVFTSNQFTGYTVRLDTEQAGGTPLGCT
jgi:hypothetical protein